MTDYITELLVDGQWQNITPDVRDSDPIVLERGRRDWATDTDPATMSLRLNNGPSKVATGVQGRYSPRNPRSDLFGKIGRNTPIRVRRDVPRESVLALPGVIGSYAFAPDAAALDITGDIDIRIEVSRDSWQTQDDIFRILAAKTPFITGDISWVFYLRDDGAPRFTWSTDGSTSARVTVSPDDVIALDAGRIALRVTLDVNNGAAGNDVRFYTSDSIDGAWTQLGATVTTAGVTSIHSGSGALAIGADSDGNVFFSDGATLDGTVYAFELRNGINGTIVADPDFTVHEPTARTFTDDAGNAWTLAASATLADPTIRFTGEAKSWPLEWDLSGADRWVKLTAAGITRRLQRGKKPLKSSLFRDLSIKDDVVAYWPLEDVAGARRFNAGRPDDGTFLVPSPSAEVTFAGDAETFFASAPLPTVGAAVIAGNAPTYSGAADQRFVFLLSIPADVTWATEKVLFRVLTTGTIKEWRVSKTAADNTRIQAFDNDGAAVEDNTFVQNLFGVPCAYSLWLHQDGADVDWQLAYFPLDGSQAFAFTDTITSETFTRIHRISLGSTDDMEQSTFGHVFILNNDVQSIWDTIDNSMVGWAGETGLTRLVRLATDEGLPAVRSIGANAAQTMGPQLPLTLMTLFREVATADLGLLSDRPDALGLQYRPRVDLYSQEPALVLDYSSGVIGDPFRPVEDDQAIVNEVTVERVRGSSSTIADTAGPLSSLDPPDGVGKYDVAQELNIDSDGSLPNQAAWRLHLGTVDEARFPELTLNLRNPRVAALEDDILAVTEGDIIRITHPPVWMPGGPYDLLVESIREQKTAVTHEIAFNCSPGSAWTVAVFDAGAAHALVLNGTSPGRASTPDTAALDIVGDIDLRVHAALDDWTPASASALMTKSTTTGSQVSWRFNVLTSGILRLAWSVDGSTVLSADSTVAPTIADGSALWVRVTLDVNNGAAGRDITFYTSADGSTWTQLGAVVTQAGVTSIFSGTSAVVIGSRDSGTLDRMTGRVFSAEIRSGISGTIVASPNFRVQPSGTTSFADSTGKTWMVVSPALIESGADALVVAGKADTAGSELDAPFVAGVDTSMDVLTTVGPVWTTSAAQFPFDVTAGGVVLTVTAIGAAVAGVQTFTVNQAPVNGVTKTIPAGDALSLAHPAVVAL